MAGVIEILDVKFLGLTVEPRLNPQSSFYKPQIPDKYDVKSLS